MRERAEKIGAKLKVLSRAAAGTEIELIVPNYAAFEKQSVNRPRQWFTRPKVQRKEQNK
jgi:signal transduction histidine kinase